MLYFNSFPYTTTTDYSGNKVVLTNILERVEVIPTLLNDVNLFYSYSVKDGDTLDIISNKYYGDSYRYWMVAYSNQLIDTQANWPMGPSLFNDYIIDKYTSATANSLHISANTVTSGQVLAYTQGTIHGYIKKVTTTDSISSTSNTLIYNIDQASYANVATGTTTKSFPGGATVTQTVTAYPEYIYDYEVSANEAKRKINLFSADYAGVLEKQLTTLLEK
jgi:hypothetical protein